MGATGLRAGEPCGDCPWYARGAFPVLSTCGETPLFPVEFTGVETVLSLPPSPSPQKREQGLLTWPVLRGGGRREEEKEDGEESGEEWALSLPPPPPGGVPRVPGGPGQVGSGRGNGDDDSREGEADSNAAGGQGPAAGHPSESALEAPFVLRAPGQEEDKGDTEGGGNCSCWGAEALWGVGSEDGREVGPSHRRVHFRAPPCGFLPRAPLPAPTAQAQQQTNETQRTKQTQQM